MITKEQAAEAVEWHEEEVRRLEACLKIIDWFDEDRETPESVRARIENALAAHVAAANALRLIQQGALLCNPNPVSSGWTFKDCEKGKPMPLFARVEDYEFKL